MQHKSKRLQKLKLNQWGNSWNSQDQYSDVSTKKFKEFKVDDCVEDFMLKMLVKLMNIYIRSLLTGVILSTNPTFLQKESDQPKLPDMKCPV